MIFGYFRFQNNTYIKRIELSDTVANQVDSQFSLQVSHFFGDENDPLRIKDFYPGLTNSEEVISRIEFDDPDGLYKVLDSSGTYPVCNPELELKNLVAVFVKNPKNKSQILIQLIEKRRILLPKTGWLIFKRMTDQGLSEAASLALSSNSSGSFVEMDSLGLQLDSKITAVYDGKYLYFKSYYQANRVLDLSDYLVSATDETISEFLSLDCISDGGHPEKIIRDLSDSQRRRVAKVMALGFVKKYSASEIEQRRLRRTFLS